jgi:hypothetical protein
MKRRRARREWWDSLPKPSELLQLSDSQQANGGDLLRGNGRDLERRHNALLHPARYWQFFRDRVAKPLKSLIHRTTVDGEAAS